MSDYSIRKPFPVSLSDLSFMQDPYPVYARMREAGQVIPVKFPMVGAIWLTTTQEACAAVLKGKDRFVIEGRRVGRKGIAGLRWWMPKNWLRLTNNMLGKDEPDHRRLRKLVDKVFARQDMLLMRPRMEELADGMLEGLEGECDLVSEYARRLPLAAISELLGVEEGDREEFASWSASLSNFSNIFDIFRINGALGRLVIYVGGLIERSRESPVPGLISDLVRVEEDGDCLDGDELLSMVLVLMMAGMETTTNLISGGVWALECNPEQKSWLLEDPEGRIEVAVEELLRYVSSVVGTKPRFVLEDMEFFGQELKRGQLVMALPGAANADPAIFEDAEVLRLDRFPNPHMSFGSGIHFCLGMQLARVEAQTALVRLYRRYPGLRLSGEARFLPRAGHRALGRLPVYLQ